MTENAPCELKLSGSSLGSLMRSVLERGASFRFRAKGGSMSPFIKDGDILTISPISFQDVKHGDVVAAMMDRTGGILVHRVINKSKHGITSRGDNCGAPDGFFSFENILGVVKLVERNGRKAFFQDNFSKKIIAFLSRTGILYTILLPVLRRLKYTIFKKNVAI